MAAFKSTCCGAPKKKPRLTYDHSAGKTRACERTLGIIAVFQDQVNQLAIDVAGFNPGQADPVAAGFRPAATMMQLLKQFHQQFMDGARSRGVDDIAAENIFNKFNGQYMFPESPCLRFRGYGLSGLLAEIPPSAGVFCRHFQPAADWVSIVWRL